MLRHLQADLEDKLHLTLTFFNIYKHSSSQDIVISNNEIYCDL